MLSTGEEKTAKHILVAVGGRPTRPDLPNSELGIVSDDLFDLPELPKSILIIGGGYIASEFAGVMNGLGVKVTQFYRGAQILRGFDNEARTLVAEQMVEKGIDLQLGTNIAEMDKRNGGVWVKSTNGDEAVFDQVLFANRAAPQLRQSWARGAWCRVERRGRCQRHRIQPDSGSIDLRDRGRDRPRQPDARGDPRKAWPLSRQCSKRTRHLWIMT